MEGAGSWYREEEGRSRDGEAGIGRRKEGAGMGRLV